MTYAWVRAITVLVAVPQVVTGAWAVLAPRHWYDTFPGFGPALPAAEPPFNQHLVTDAGAGFLAVGVVLALAAAWGRRDALMVALAGQLVFTVPHLIYHAATRHRTSARRPMRSPSWCWALKRFCPSYSSFSSERNRMNMLRRIWSHLLVLTRARRNRGDLPRWLLRRPQLAVAVGVYESALLACGRLRPELKVLATAKVAMKVNCEFCLDIGSAIARIEGVDEQKLLALPHYAESELFTDLERLVISFADEMTRTPALVPDDLRDALLTHLSKAELMELAAEIAWENQRARLHQGLGVRPAGFSDGAVCLVPEPAAKN